MTVDEVLAALQARELNPEQAAQLLKHSARAPVEVGAAHIDAALEVLDAPSGASLQQQIIQTLSAALYLEAADIDVDQPLNELGMDSIIAVEWVRALNRLFGTSIAVTAVYEHPCVRAFATYLGGLLRTVQVQPRNGVSGAMPGFPSADTGGTGLDVASAEAIGAPPLVDAHVSHVREAHNEVLERGLSLTPPAPAAEEDDAIAVIGASGQFPMAKDLEQFWRNLREGRDCVVEIPDRRWSMGGIHESQPLLRDQLECKWMGAMEDVDLFDPLFFRIAPADAEVMDPQQRLFLQNCWSCIEDAAIDASALSGTRCGVFAGCSAGDYSHLLGRGQMGAESMIGSAPSILAARIAYFLNLNGPCLSIDTACSSSLVAIATACDSLILGRSDLALAGGVCVLAGPGMHIMAGKAGMLSKRGGCFTFDGRADGFVPGEGVGVVLLKRLSDARRDGDPIRAIIRGWGVNQDGKTSGITAPSARAQCLLQKEVFERFKIDPASISLVEAHGTGTKLGDPIEVEALTGAFGSVTEKRAYCALGSVKSNVGHLMAAAGVSGLIKVILALQERMLPPTINFEHLNEHIRLDDGPFFINTSLTPWKASGAPRRAAVSSFGFSGTNAHVVVEECESQESPAVVAAEPELIVLSARNLERLTDLAGRLAEHLEAVPTLRAADVACTLQLGRQAMQCRLAFVASSTAQIAETLADFARGVRAPRVHVGRNSNEKGQGGILQGDEDAQALLHAWLRKRRLSSIAKAWVDGADVEWRLLNAGRDRRRIHLPTYPFARERYWVAASQPERPVTGISSGASVLHPLVHQNTSDFDEQRFSSVFSGEEFYLADHRVGGERVLPGVAYLEMACAALSHAGGALQTHARIRLRNVVWARPFAVKQMPGRLNIGLHPADAGEVGFEVYGPESSDDERQVYSQGWATRDVALDCGNDAAVPLRRLQEQPSHSLDQGDLYRAHRQFGIEYGAAHQGVRHVRVGEDERGARFVLAELQLPQVVSETHTQFVLHPTLLDSALHASLAMRLVDAGSAEGPGRPMLPYALEELTVLGRCPAHAYAWIREAAGSSAKVHKLDIDLCDEDGKVYVQVRGFSARVLEGGSAEAGAVQEAQPVVEAQELMRFEEHWQEQPLSGGRAGGRAALVCFVDTQAAQEQVLQVLREQHLGPVVFIGRDHQYTCTDGTHYGIRAGQVEDYASALRTIVQEHGTPEAVLYLWAVQEQEPVGQCTELVRLVQALGREQVNCARVLVAGNGRDELEQAQVQSWHGFMRSLRPVLPHGWMSVVGEQSASASSIGEWSRRLWAELGAERAQAVRYEGDRRQVSVMREVSWAEEAGEGVAGLRRGGTYLITGGAGGLGLVFARYLARRYAANLILTGRAPLEEGRRGQLRELEELGSQVLYVSADVCDEAQMSAVVREGERAFGAIHGVIHSAGVSATRSVLEKSVEEFQAVLAAKVQGTLVLDRVLAQRSVDFICYFSSSSAVLGDFGSCDYSIGNRFQHAHAVTSHSGPRRVSIAWPLWREGGLQVGDAQQTQSYLEASGQRLLESEEGVGLFEQVLARGIRQQLVLAGYPSRLRRLLGIESQKRSPERGAASTRKAEPGQDVFLERTLQYLKKTLSGTLKLDAERIDARVPFEHYGIDSIMVMQLSNALEKSFGSLSKTLFFEYQNLDDLSNYFTRAHTDRLRQLLELPERTVGMSATCIGGSEEASAPLPTDRDLRRNRLLRSSARPPAAAEAPAVVAEGQEIAIIGLSGRYPQARNVWEFWENLKAGRDSITEIPAERWDYRAYFDPQKGTLGKSYSKWGGFLDGVAEFDPLFFNISPREAEMLDPQERLFLQCVYETVEDAGYTRESLGHHRSQGLEGNVGVFVGVMYQEYQLYGAQAQAIGRHVAVPGNTSSVANRVSYFFNWHGPSISLDTACSSSLTAIHLACQSLQRGGCEVAIAGGVNVSVHPNKYLALSQGQFCSSQGRCESFGEGGDGYVPGEGVGAVLLKPLWRARQDGDQIYGVIKASAINHGGKTNGYSVPNPVAQSQVVSQCLKSLDVPVRAISYVEAHGTGTSLGDPIEVAGLSRAFEAHTGEKQFCALGSAKSNIGHCESAAGIAGITKVLLQMKHRTLVPSLHSRVLNPHIDFADTPFVVQQQLGAWTRPVLKEDAGLREYPLLAGVSSFGAGGANAHVILQEYVQEGPSAELGTGPALVVLSGSSEAVLQEQARRLLQWIQEQGLQESQLGSLAYTLQVGREALEHRVGMRVRTLEQLKERLGRYVAGERGIEDVYRGEVKRNKEALSSFATDEDLQAALGAWLEKGKYGKLLELWVKGLAVQWSRLYAGSPPRRMSLPTYPFAKERFWIPEGLLTTQAGNGTGTAVLHPLVQTNTSSFEEQRFSSVFSGEEFYLADHRVRGERVLPGVAYLEMARAALEQEAAFADAEFEGLRLRNVVWTQPFTIGERSAQLHVTLSPLDSGEVEYEIYSAGVAGAQTDAARRIHSQGRALPLRSEERPIESRLPLASWKERCDRHISSKQCYDAYRDLGIDYGAAHRGVVQISLGEDERGDTFVLGELSLPEVVSQTSERFGLHPSLMDSALQCCLAWTLADDVAQDESSGGVMLPYALDELSFHRPIPARAFVHIARASTVGRSLTRYDLQIADAEGRVCVEMIGFTCRELVEGEARDQVGTVLLQPGWHPQQAPAPRDDVGECHAVLCLSEELALRQAEGLRRSLPDVQVVYWKDADVAAGFEATTQDLINVLQGILQEKSHGKVLVQLIIAGLPADSAQQEVSWALSGVLKAARLENPLLSYQVIAAPATATVQRLQQLLQQNRTAPSQLIRYVGDERQVLHYEPIIDAIDSKHPFSPSGVYLITGGTGGLGCLFAEEILSHVPTATVVLAARRAPNAEQTELLRRLGTQVHFVQLDVGDGRSVESAVREIRARHGRLSGVIHAAGAVRDSFLIRKTSDEIEEVLRAKVRGTVNLDEATKDDPLDLFVLFSSISAVAGNIGQADYCTANGFMDAYARYRQGLTEAGVRRGRTVSINWPLWLDGSMKVDDANLERIREQSGLTGLPRDAGMRAFHRAIAHPGHQVVVAHGLTGRLRTAWLEWVNSTALVAGERAPSISVPASGAAGEASTSADAALDYFRRLVAKSLKLDADRIEEEGSFERYGIDSVLVMQMTNELEKSFGSLPKTLFFEYQTLRELSGYFLRRHADRLQQLVGAGKEGGGRPVSAVVPGVDGGARKPRAGRARGRWRGRPPAAAEAPAVVAEGQEIAIIGLSGRYPQARNVWEFWENLKAGRDSITEIPAERWDYRAYFDPQKGTLGKSYSKWGGFLDGVAEFDPLFFNISPREAEMLDPQERLFLQCVYETVEDAGYTRESLGHHRSQGLEGNVGVFVGVMYEEYQLYGAQAQALGQPLGLISTPASIANRVSYFFNWHGPSMAVDTMCSSSLTAIHLACQSLQRGGCEVAIAGGVNVSVHPNKYLALSQGQFCSSQGRCESFGEGGDGYVPGEGVGAVLLKPLWRARQDGDQIYGVIKASAINHGGKTNGYSVPNPVAQSQVVSQCLKSLDVPVRAISYVEAHGTGTSLGDPIEVAGLSRAFEAHTGEKQFCALGSAKSNIGHCESAAGIAGITKVLLQMKHRTLVPSLHSRVLNPHIDFADTPFVVQQQLGAWTRPVLKEDAGLREYPLLAGVSSFGAGGANAHVILQEYVQEGPSAELGTGPALVVLSGSSEAVLQEQARRLLQWIQEQGLQESQLGSLAYTLQVGREALEHRVGMRVRTLEQLKERLGRYVAGERGIEDVYRGEVKRNKEALSSFATDEDLQAALGAWLEKGKYGKLLELWVKGLAVQWSRLYAGSPPRRMSLPTYPFAKERFWIPGGMLESVLSQARRPGAAPLAVLHPLVQHNTSVLGEQRFSSVFSGEEFYLADHRVRGERVLPGVAYLEMARAALEQADEADLSAVASGIRITNVVWARPFSVMGEPQSLHVGLYILDGGEVEYQVYSTPGGATGGDAAREVHSQGCVARELLDFDGAGRIPLHALLSGSDRHMNAQECYEACRTIGLEYGAAHQGIHHLSIGTDSDGARYVLAELGIPQVVSETHAQFVLHPTLLDSALHASIGLATTEEASDTRVRVPYALEELTVLGRCPAHAYAWIREAAGSSAKVHKLDIDLCDEDGKVYVQVRGFSARVLEGGSAEAGAVQEAQPVVEAQELMRFEEHWQEQPLSGGRAGGRAALVCFVDTQAAQEQVLQVLREQHLGPVVFIGRDHQYTCTDGTHYGIRAGQVEDYASALRTIVQEHGTPEAVLYLWAVQEQEPVGQCTELVRLVQALGREQVNCARVLVAGNGRDELEQAQVQSWHGFMRSLRPVLPHGWMSVVGEQSASASSIGEWSRRLWAELGAERAQAVRYEGDRRQVSVMREVSWAEEAGEGVAGLRRGGTYLITGGAGGLGLVFARYLARRYAANLILTGRAPLEEGRRGQLRELEELGSQVLYVSADVCDEAQMSAVVREGERAFGAIHGVIHSAGVSATRSVLEKSVEEFQAVLAAKVQGTLVLDRVLAQRSVDFICYFSSSSAVLGDFGSCDYSIGNRFQHAHAVTSHSGPRRVSIAWPLWREGGLQVGDAQQTQSYLEASGQRLLESEEGVGLFEQVLARGIRQQLVLAGYPSRLRRLLGIESTAQPPRRVSNTTVPSSTQRADANPSGMAIATHDALTRRTIQHLKTLLAVPLGLDADRIEADASLERYGIDSVLVMQMTDELQNSFGSLSKTLFFEYQTLEELSAYFVREHEAKLRSLLGMIPQSTTTVPAVQSGNVERNLAAARPPRTRPTRNARRARALARAVREEPSDIQMQEIAIVGLSGRYPQARDMSEFWDNLKAGKDSITEVPADRWDYRRHFDERKGTPGKTYSKWGGFIDGVAEFDPLFFNISPREAEMLDPQERLFLQCVYETVEDAGYTRESLSRRGGQGREGSVGVFVGVMYQEYQLFGAEAQARGKPFGLINNSASIANRVSYFFNWHGPSMAVDTMCSSSLTSIHLACQSLQQGACEVAIAGGVNISAHPNKYLALSQGQFCSSEGRCESFGEGGDGYVPGEGVGAVMLKPLWRAQADGDHIYGVIKASAINHGGKTNGYSVPNPAAQAQVVSECLQSSGIPARAISYVEAHGTGTSLGDPIEMTGLKRAFEMQTTDRQFCALGSVKSNIGHCESAAGISGVTKVLLQMMHRQLVPSLHSEVLNPHIDFANTPFIVQQRLAPWDRPVIQKDGVAREYPRLAGVSSFGAGGANAHLIIQEHVEDTAAEPATIEVPTGGVMIVLSGSNAGTLKEQARRLIGWIHHKELRDSQLPSLAYTLQVGRASLEHRLATTVSSIQQLVDRLQRFVNGETAIEELYRGEVNRTKNDVSAFVADEDLQQALRSWLDKGKYGRLLELWVKGLAFDWRVLYGEQLPRRISLPTYPFARERYWISVPESQDAHVVDGAARKVSARRHRKFDEKFYEEMLDAILSGESSISDAVASAEGLVES